MVLEDAGYTMLQAPDGTQTVDLLRAAARPLVVLLDLALPRACEGAILRAIQAEPALARHCYVAVTALATFRLTPQVRNLVNTTCSEVVAKPFDIDDLLAAVQRADQRLAAQSGRLVGQGVQLDGALGAGFPPASTSHG
jgi:CheY-like chemotaxis protein